jgi:immune inhibitor A
MMCSRCLLIITLLVLVIGAACTALPTPSPTPTLTPLPTHTPAPTHTNTPAPLPTATPTATPSPTSSPAPDPTLADTPVPTAAPAIPPTVETGSLTPDIPSVDPPPRPFDGIVVNAEPPRRVPNAVRSFWVAEGANGGQREVTARLRVQTEHVAMWVEEGVWHDVRMLQEAAIFFQAQIYSTTRAAFGSEWTPGVDNDPHIHILHATGLGEGVLGYTSSADELPRALYPTSNEAELIVVHADLVPVGSAEYYGLLAHQFQRLIQWSQDRNEESWVRDGLADLAVRRNGFDTRALEWDYLEQPDTSLTGWQAEQDPRQRGAAYLFAVYFSDRFGDEGTRALVAQPLNGSAGFNAALTELGAALSFDDLFADWLAANYLDSEPLAHDSHYSYTTLDVERPSPSAVYERFPVTMDAAVQQFGADYILLRGNADLRLQFTGTITTPLLDVIPHSGRGLWWSNCADESQTTLARAFDLTGIANTDPISLTYWTWYEIESGYDYATVDVSTDGGETWEVLITPSGTADDPHHNNPGWGYTGQSGDTPGWIHEVVDLSPYAGRQVQVRFAYLTDGAITGRGFLLDDIAVPRIGYADDLEQGGGGWEPAGFVYSDGAVSQRYLALLLGLAAEDGAARGVVVRRLPTEGSLENNSVEWKVPLGSEGWREAVIALSGLAPFTTRPAHYHLAISE